VRGIHSRVLNYRQPPFRLQPGTPRDDRLLCAILSLDPNRRLHGLTSRFGHSAGPARTTCNKRRKRSRWWNAQAADVVCQRYGCPIASSEAPECRHTRDESGLSILSLSRVLPRFSSFSPSFADTSGRGPFILRHCQFWDPTAGAQRCPGIRHC
jgi:hypothetical protein